MRDLKRFPLFFSLALGAGVSVVLVIFARVTVATHLAIFLCITAVSYGLLRYFLDRWVLEPLRDLKRRLAAMGIGDQADDPSDTTAGLMQGIEKDVERYAATSRAEIEQLHKLEVFRRDFVADVSHELKTPIFAAQGFVHTLLDGAAREKNTRKKFLKKAAKSLDGLDMLVQDLLTLSHIETGQIRMRFEDIDLYALTEDVFEQFRGKSNRKKIVLRIQSRSRKVIAYADRLRIHQVITNLVSNAIKHSDDGAEVIVSFEIRKGRVITGVKDFGEGIPAEHIRRIFERFYRIDKSRSREKGGTGLGLAIVKHILDSHNTSVQVESEPGKGSFFSFSLPTDRGQMSAHGEYDASAKAQGRPTGGQVQRSGDL